MPHVTFEVEDAIYTFETPGNARSYEFTDHTGKEVTFYVHGFYDPRFTIEQMGFQTKAEVLDWWMANRDTLFPQLTVASRDWIRRWFERDDISTVDREWLSSYINLRDHPFQPYRNTSRSSGDGAPILLVDDEQEDVIKPAFLLSFGWGGYIDASPTSSHPVDSVDATGIDVQWIKLHNYSFKMEPEAFGFFRTLSRESKNEVTQYGMEVEVSTKLSTKEIQRIVCEVEPVQEPFFIFKSDSSVSGCYRNKIEIVTVPCSRRYLRQNWKIFFEKLQTLCAKRDMNISDVFDCSDDLNNGIHIHVSRSHFLSHFHSRKFVAAWNQWDKTSVDHFTEVSRRKDYRGNQYCQIDRNYEGYTLARRLKRTIHTSGRSVCHFSSGPTVEVRLFQGIFDVDHIIRCLDHVDAIFEFTDRIGVRCFGRSFIENFKEYVIKNDHKYSSLLNLFQKA